MPRDVFAQIAADFRTSDRPFSLRRGKPLTIPQPPQLPERFLPTDSHNPDAAFQPRPVFTADDLQAELVRLRVHYAPFMRNLAPAPDQTRHVVPLGAFEWRLQDGDWETVAIPHYGGPIGRATAYYRTTFTVTPTMLDMGSLWVCFEGVDYKAHVFVNEHYLGSHEGFFAPFEFDCTAVVHPGENTLMVRVENDAIFKGNQSWDQNLEGDKLYAATGPGWDDPELGWHHCPPGMGIYQPVHIEARPTIFVHDIFVRPLLDDARAEAWIEVYHTGQDRRDIAITLSLYGQNFEATLFEGMAYELPGTAGPTLNYYRLPFEVPELRRWEPDAPWLYQLQVTLTDDTTVDIQTQHFGMRSFVMDEDGDPKGRLYLNGGEIRLRGANTMGHLQQCVMHGDWDQLRDDILLCKVAHMNFLRFTQRPVQSAIYDYCDMLGMMTQTDLPLFGVLRRNQFLEAVCQAEAMERLVRSHPCNVLNSYINEAFPNARGNPHRHLTRPELERFFAIASDVIRLQNPERVIKYNDGDYDPPDDSYPDRHCYCGWYNGHGVAPGKLHKGYWQEVKPGWMYGCGEFGAEGLDPKNVMRRYYPQSWLPTEDEIEWTPDRIVKAQTARFHHFWFETPHTLEGWIAASQQHQADIMHLMTEAFRRDSRMNSFAAHLGIDAFPAGWMKALMDVDRQPKPAYFAYRDALTPLMVSLRTDRFSYWSGETICIEAWVCNDENDYPDSLVLHYQIEHEGQILLAQTYPAEVPECSSRFQGFICFRSPEVKERSNLTIRLALINTEGIVLHDASLDLSLFPHPTKSDLRRAYVLGEVTGTAARVAREIGLSPVFNGPIESDAVILIDDYARFEERREDVENAVASGALAVFLELPVGEYQLGDHQITVMPCVLNKRHFVSRATGHSAVQDLQPNDLKFLYDADAGYITAFLSTTFAAVGWEAMLLAGNGEWAAEWKPSLVAGEAYYGQGCFRICQMELAGRMLTNPAVMLFARQLVRPTRQ